MITFPGPVEFLMGSPETEAGRSRDETQHRRKIERSFAIAAAPVTLAQYRQFAATHEASKDYSTGSVDCPAVNVSWYEAAGYCNWLSEREGIPKDQWCYEIIKNGLVTAIKADAMKLNGYRLPTEAEWEYAVRAIRREVLVSDPAASCCPTLAGFKTIPKINPAPSAA